MMRWLAHLRKRQARDAAREYDGTAFLDKLDSALSAAPGLVRWHHRQKINALVYQAIVD